MRFEQLRVWTNAYKRTVGYKMITTAAINFRFDILYFFSCLDQEKKISFRHPAEKNAQKYTRTNMWHFYKTFLIVSWISQDFWINPFEHEHARTQPVNNFSDYFFSSCCIFMLVVQWMDTFSSFFTIVCVCVRTYVT